MNPFPIPAATPEKHKPVERLVEKILAAKAQAAADDVSALEREIDQLVNALCALTPAEIHSWRARKKKKSRRDDRP